MMTEAQNNRIVLIAGVMVLTAEQSPSRLRGHRERHLDKTRTASAQGCFNSTLVKSRSSRRTKLDSGEIAPQKHAIKRKRPAPVFRCMRGVEGERFCIGNAESGDKSPHSKIAPAHTIWSAAIHRRFSPTGSPRDRRALACCARCSVYQRRIRAILPTARVGHRTAPSFSRVACLSRCLNRPRRHSPAETPRPASRTPLRRSSP